MATASKPAKKAAPKSSAANGFTADERAAMQDRVAELKAERGRASKAADAAAVLAKIAGMPEADRKIAERIHEIILAAAPMLAPKTWYGMPAYALDGKIVCFFQAADKFKVRYATLGFSDQAHLDDGNMWPNSYALKKLTAADEKRVKALVKQAVS